MAMTPYLLGEHLTAVTITPLTIAANGAITPGAASNIHAYIGSIDPTLEIGVEDIRPVWQTQRNEVPLDSGDSVRIGVLQRSDDANILQSLARSTTSKRFIVAWSQGTEDFSMYLTLRSVRGGIQNRGANMLEADFGPMDPGAPGTAQTTYS